MDQLEKEETCAACKYVSKDVMPSHHLIKDHECWSFMVMELSNVHDPSMFANIYHVKVIVCPRCKTMRAL